MNIYIEPSLAIIHCYEFSVKDINRCGTGNMHQLEHRLETMLWEWHEFLANYIHTIISNDQEPIYIYGPGFYKEKFGAFLRNRYTVVEIDCATKAEFIEIGGN